MNSYSGENRDAYRKGYLSGYRAGYEDGKVGRPKVYMDAKKEAYPIEMMGLSTRAYNCLYFSGCQCAGDVARMEESQIRQVRNLGKVTAGEIANALERMGIRGSDWVNYLKK